MGVNVWVQFVVVGPITIWVPRGWLSQAAWVVSLKNEHPADAAQEAWQISWLRLFVVVQLAVQDTLFMKQSTMFLPGNKRFCIE
jgi:hypothetical protein